MPPFVNAEQAACCDEKRCWMMENPLFRCGWASTNVTDGSKDKKAPVEEEQGRRKGTTSNHNDNFCAPKSASNLPTFTSRRNWVEWVGGEIGRRGKWVMKWGYEGRNECWCRGNSWLAWKGLASIGNISWLQRYRHVANCSCALPWHASIVYILLSWCMFERLQLHVNV